MLYEIFLLVEKQNELLLMNHDERPTRTPPMQNHVTRVSTTQFKSQRLQRRLNPKKKCQILTQKEPQREHKCHISQLSQKHHFVGPSPT